MAGSLVHVVATGDPRASTASLSIRREAGASTCTTLDLKDAQVTVGQGAFDNPVALLSMRSIDSTGNAAVF